MLRIRRQADSGALPIPLESIRQASPVASDSTPSPTPQESKSPPNPRAATALKACRAKVQAADKVLAAGKHGMRHWSEHVQAQTDAFAGKITVGKMDDIFDRTRKAGDQDENRYDEAVESYHSEHGSCRAVAGAHAQLNNQLARCAKRARAQRPVLAAAEDGMADWTTHVGDMRRSKQGKIHNPQKKWLQTWRAAPPHIKAYKKAAGHFSAPEC